MPSRNRLLPRSDDGCVPSPFAFTVAFAGPGWCCAVRALPGAVGSVYLPGESGDGPGESLCANLMPVLRWWPGRALAMNPPTVPERCKCARQRLAALVSPDDLE